MLPGSLQEDPVLVGMQGARGAELMLGLKGLVNMRIPPGQLG